MEPDVDAIRAAASEMLNRLRDAERIAEASTPRGPHRLDAMDRTIPALHRRVRRAARAVHLLLTQDLPYEASIVARSLFEDSMRLGTLRQAGGERTRLILGWMNDSTTHAERMLREGAKSTGQGQGEVEEALRLRRRNLTNLAKGLDVPGKMRPFGDVRGMAKSLGRLDEYHHYLYATQITHGAESAYLFDPDPVGDVSAEITVPSFHVAGVALGLSVTPVLRAHIDTAEMLGWPGGEEAAALLNAPLAID